mmetsp:Transcript_12003/g.26179  ORF Transcript_12003/g.26179 Transcript_12003/m.26179 type:complete len:1309 (-) Transcript_12003:106-4032(-)|eukprot:CAMPEP_0172323654 /NCGR_PEP_ID=MMETSP1058-20130122/49329_1 /TAXON_ID=83371 /ORGANISM="Detonula confervacea, Strain CCMP 353" /LENGTH=1308 /DNA_ID=CAMNT_0013039715 /DNA_START=111 /DNA_END=4037 /DNA_ORIENTATION=+
MNSSATNKSEEDEAQLLAALGSTAASASAYEQSVLRDAKLKSAPQIALPHSTIATNIANKPKHNVSSSSLVPCGEERPSLPDLSSLGPSTASSRKKKGAAAADVPHVLKVLSRTRNLLQSTLSGSKGTSYGNNSEENEQKQQREIDLLRMKEQILLGYLTDVAGLREDDAVIPQRKIGNGRKRRRSGDAGDDYYGNAAYDDSNDILGEAIAKKSAAKKGSKTRGRKVKSADIEPPSTSRLDRIKNGEQLDTTQLQKRSLKRNTMMSMKSQMRKDSGLAPLKTMEEERFDADKSRKRREERRKRRLKRQRAALGIESSSDEEAELDAKPGKVTGILKKSKKDDAEHFEEEKKSEDGIKYCKELTESKGQDEITKKSGVSWASTSEATLSKQTPDSKKRTTTKVFCPICQVILTVDGEGEGISPDEFLANHVTECQKTSRERNGGRTLRTRKKPAVVDLAGDEADDTEKEIEVFTTDQSGAVDDELKVDYEETSRSKMPPASIDDMDELDYEDRVDDWVDRGLERMGHMAERDSSEIPPGAVVYEGGLEIPAWINDRIFPYQRTGVRWMWELHCQGAGGVVGDEMGLGKTVQVSSFLGAMAGNRLLDSVLIIAPATVLAHWLRELAVWAPGLRRIMVHRSGESDGVSRVVSRGMLRSLQRWLTNARADRVNEAIDEDDYNESKDHAFCGTGYAVVTTYENIRRSPDEWTNHNWSYVVLDEGQKIRNPDAGVTLAVKRLRTPHRLLLSGTPIQNDLRELWSLFDFIFPGRLGTLPAFEAEFAEPIKRGGYSNASPMQVQLAYRCALVLRDLINPYLLRRQKKDVKEVNRMPGKTEQVLFCRLSSTQRSLYEEYLRSDEVMGVAKGSVQLLKAVTVLRKICNHPDLVAPNGRSLCCDDASSSSSDEDFYEQEKLAERSGKLQVLSKILPLWHKQGHKVIIFTQWRKMLTILEQFVNLQGWKYARLDGNTNIASRQKLVDNFNNDDTCFCMLMTTRTGGVGLNITGANRVLLYDPDWNPQTDAQARERAWRFGQKRAVTVYRLISAGTIEEKIYQRQIFKTALTNQVLQDPKQRRLFSQKHLKDLFTLKADTNDVTETGEITKGGGVVEMNNSEEPSESENKDEQPADNYDWSKGLCGIFDHDFVENPSAKKKPLSVVEMEENARKVAMKAALALKESSENKNRFEPTWTGSDETKQFGGASSAGVASAGGKGMASSSSLLANLQNKRMQIASSGKSATSRKEQDADTKKYSSLLLRIKKYIGRLTSNGTGPTTRDLLSEFDAVPDSDAAVFRSMLKSAAVIKNGRWALREEN